MKLPRLILLALLCRPPGNLLASGFPFIPAAKTTAAIDSPTTAPESANGPLPQTPDSDPGTIFRRGKLALQNGQLQEAESYFRRVIALDPRSAAAHINLGVVLMRQRRWDNAQAEFKIAQKLAPAEPGISLNIGLIHYRKGEFAQAIEPISIALQSMPENHQSRYLLGLCYFFVNRYKDATETLAPLWQEESANLNFLYVLTIAAARSANPGLQDRAFDQMLAIGKDTPEFHLYAGKARLAEGDTGQALTEFQTAASASPRLPLVHYFLGRTWLERKSYPEAIAELEMAVKDDSTFAYSYEDLGILYAQLDQPAKAELSFQQAIERNGNLVNSFLGLAKLFRDSRHFDKALECIDRAVELVPQSASLHFTRGQILKQLGRSSQAKEEFDNAARLHKAFNDRLQQDHSADTAADAEAAAQE